MENGTRKYGNIFPFGTMCSNVVPYQTGVQTLLESSQRLVIIRVAPQLANGHCWLSMCQHCVKSGMTFHLYITLQSHPVPGGKRLA